MIPIFHGHGSKRQTDTDPGPADDKGASSSGPRGPDQCAATSWTSSGSLVCCASGAVRSASGFSRMVSAVSSATAMKGPATRNTSSIDWVKAVSTQVLTGSGSDWMAVTSLTELDAAPSWPCAEAG